MRRKERDYDTYIDMIRSVVSSSSLEDAEEIIERERKRIWDTASFSIEKRKEIDLHLQLMFMREKRDRNKK
jgi:hypothetical protein